MQFTTPPGLVSRSSKRKQRHRRSAVKRALADSQSLPPMSSCDASTLSSILHTSSSNASDACGEWYIGEPLQDMGVQTDLSTSPGDVLAYSSDPAYLLEVVVYNALHSLQQQVQAHVRDADELLMASPGGDTLQQPVEPEAITSTVAHEADTCDEDIRLCRLRLAKVEKQWSALCNSVLAELAASADDDNEHSLILQDALDICTSIGELMKSRHTSGVWCSRGAVVDALMSEFGHVEGIDAVEEHLDLLGICKCNTTKPLLQWALQLAINNRCDVDIERL